MEEKMVHNVCRKTSQYYTSGIKDFGNGGSTFKCEMTLNVKYVRKYVYNFFTLPFTGYSRNLLCR